MSESQCYDGVDGGGWTEDKVQKQTSLFGQSSSTNSPVQRPFGEEQ